MDVDAMLADLTKQMDHTFLDLPDLVSDDEGPPGARPNPHSGWSSGPQQPQQPVPHHQQHQQPQQRPPLQPDALQHQLQHHHQYHHQYHSQQHPSQAQYQQQLRHLQQQQVLMQYQDDSLSLLQPHLLHLLGPQTSSPHLLSSPQPDATPTGGTAAQHQQPSSPSAIPAGSAGASDAVDMESGD